LCTVVGAGPGLGAELVKTFARDGLDVAYLARRPARLQQALDGFEHDYRVGGFAADVDDRIGLGVVLVIKGTGASQYGIGAVAARLAEVVLRDEHAVLPVAAYYPDYAVTLSLVSVLGRDGVQMHQPQMSDEEQVALQRSVATLQAASQACRSPGHTTPTGGLTP
jgi:NAD(P)-dependent dehydrogenase (short-subunit alcohol dehydrogenase family)